jgi:bifunctional non-homologous end joining protein LigD
VSTVEITHPDKLLFPDDGLSKGDVAGYYERVSEWMLPHIRSRPISMQRFPDGVGGKGFFHKDTPDYFPRWLRRVEVPKSGGTVTHVYACDAETLVYLVGQNTITPHVWLSRVDRLWQPDRMVIDLDPPPGSDFNAVRRAARHTGDLLRELGLTPFAQVTGSKGIHVWTPLRRRAGNDEVRAFARDLGRVLADRHPQELTSEWRKEKRDAQHVRADGRAAVRRAPAPRRAGGHPDRLGRAVRLEAPPGPLDREERPEAARGEGRPVGRHPELRARNQPSPAPAVSALTHRLRYLNDRSCFNGTFDSSSNHARVTQMGPLQWGIGWDDAGAPCGRADGDFNDLIATVNATYRFGGLQSPVDPGALNPAKAGSAIPVRAPDRHDRGDGGRQQLRPEVRRGLGPVRLRLEDEQGLVGQLPRAGRDTERRDVAHGALRVQVGANQPPAGRFSSNRPAAIAAAMSFDSSRYAEPSSNSIAGYLRCPVSRSRSSRFDGRSGPFTTS